MSHVLFFSNWKNQNLSELKKMLSKDLIATFSDSKYSTFRCDYEKVIEIFKTRFMQNQDWQFDIIARYFRGTEEIVMANIFREDEEMNLLEKKSAGIFVFDKYANDIQLVRIHLEMELE